MRQKNQKYASNDYYPQQTQQSPSQPIKSPSPDKKRANIITPTKSPELIQINRNMSPLMQSQKKQARTPIELKPYEQSTRYYTNQDFQEYRSSQKKNEIFEELQNMRPEEFVLQGSRYASNPQSKQLDYIRLLQQKERTIKQLHQIIQMINRNNSLDLSNSQIMNNTNRKKIFESSQKTVFTYKSNDLATQKQLKNQVRILTIQNQQLLHMVQKLTQQKQQIQQLQENLKKDQLDFSTYRMKQSILSRQIYQMKQSLLQKQFDYQTLQKQNTELYRKFIEADQQNQKLIKMMKDKQLSDRKYHSSLIESGISGKVSDSQVREKLTLVKIKEQYNESLKAFKENVEGEVEEFMKECNNSTEIIHDKLASMEHQLQTLEKFRSAYQAIKAKRQLQLKQSQFQNKRSLEKSQRRSLEELSQIEIKSPEKSKHKEIQSLLMEKNQMYEKQLQTERESNREMNRELEQMRDKYRELQGKYRELELRSRERVVIARQQLGQQKRQPMRQSRKHSPQIQQINLTKSQQAQISRLNLKLQQLQQQLSQLTEKNQTYEQIIQSQRQQFQEKQAEAHTKMSEKETEIRRNSSVLKSEIDHLRELLSEKDLGANVYNEENMEMELNNLRRELIERRDEYEIKLKQYEETLRRVEQDKDQIQNELTNSLKQHQVKLKQTSQQNESLLRQLTDKQRQLSELRQQLSLVRQEVSRQEQGQSEKQQRAREQVQKLIGNYEQEITILKGTISQMKVQHSQQTQQLTSEVNRLSLQAQNTQKLLLKCQQGFQEQRQTYQQQKQAYQQQKRSYQQQKVSQQEQLQQIQQRVTQLQQLLNTKNHQSRQLLNQKNTLIQQHQSMKQHLQQLLAITKQVQNLQQQNSSLKHQLQHTQQQLSNKQSTIAQNQQFISQNHLTIQQHLATISELQQQLGKQNCVERQLELARLEIGQLEVEVKDMGSRIRLVRKQSEDQISRKDLQLTVEVEKYQAEKAEYQYLIRGLKGDVNKLEEQLKEVRNDSLLYRQSYNQLLTLKSNPQLLTQLTQLQSLITTQPQQSQQDLHYDLNKLHLDYSHQLQQNQLLNTTISQLRQQHQKNLQERHLLQEKITYLEKNIAIYNAELKERKNFCEQLVVDKTKVEKELVMMKKMRIEAKVQDNDKFKREIAERVNRIVKLEEGNTSEIKRIVEKRSQSPIRQITSLISKVDESRTFSTFKLQHPHE